jgi:CheY-like chemotaxis protein
VKFTVKGEVEGRLQAQKVVGSKTKLRCAIEDTGIGNAPERMDRVFKPFSQVDASTTRKYGGTGLGLMISKRLCQLMGGTLWLESKKDVGSTFYFTVLVEVAAAGSDAQVSPSSTQLSRPQSLPSKPESDNGLNKSHSLRILLAEDNVVNQKVGLKILERLGYKADVAQNGLEVLASLEKQAYDVILMDIQMPEMDGVEATRQIHDRWPAEERPYIVAMTAHALTSDRELYLSEGMDDYISKPVCMDELRQTLERCQRSENTTVDTGVNSGSHY